MLTASGVDWGRVYRPRLSVVVLITVPSTVVANTWTLAIEPPQSSVTRPWIVQPAITVLVSCGASAFASGSFDVFVEVEPSGETDDPFVESEGLFVVDEISEPSEEIRSAISLFEFPDGRFELSSFARGVVVGSSTELNS
jgi:hypothetical protein